jgi:hypothetical protein
MVTADEVWRRELEQALVAAGYKLVSFAETANIHASLAPATRAAVARVAARVSQPGLVFHPDQAAVALLDASSSGATHFAGLLAQMKDEDLPASWISRGSDWLASRSKAWSDAAAVFRRLVPARPLSFEALVGEIRRVTGLGEARSTLAEHYRALDVPGAQEVCDRALTLRAEDPLLRELCESILARASSAVPGALLGRHGTLVEQGVLDPPWLFRGADEIVTARLIRILEAGHPGEEASSMVEALAWIGGEAVAQRLVRWSTAGAPPWLAYQRVLPRDHAQHAGWWLSEKGETRPLVHQGCRRLVAQRQDTLSMSVFVPSRERCPHCKARLSFAVDLDLASAELAFLGLAGSRLRILTCERCAAFGPIYSEVTLDGGARWSRRTRRTGGDERDEWEPVGGREVWLSAPVAPTEALARTGDDQSQLGGYPTWEQDAEYPACPACARPMPCLGQLAMETFDAGDGFVYLFLDAACGFAATTLQHT